MFVSIKICLFPEYTKAPLVSKIFFENKISGYEYNDDVFFKISRGST